MLPQHERLFCSNGFSALKSLTINVLHLSEVNNGKYELSPNPADEVLIVLKHFTVKSTVILIDDVGDLYFLIILQMRDRNKPSVGICRGVFDKTEC